MDNPAMRGLFGRLGLSQPAAHFVVHDQSINQLSILQRLTDDEVESLCRICRKPGGQIINPNAADPGQPDVMANPGISVAALHTENIKLAAFYLRLMANVSRVRVLADVTLINIEAARNYKEEIEAHENLKVTDAPTLKPTKVFEFFAELREYAFDMVGSVSKIPIAYVIREHEDPLPEATEPPFGEPDSPFSSFNHELVARAPIYHVGVVGAQVESHYYSLDRVMVWKILYQICNGTMYYSYIRQYQQSRDGRAAFFALYNALLGSQAVANYASAAENKLQSLSLTGQKSKNWGFEKYVLSHMDQHTILEKLTEHGHSGIDETSKIRHFSRGITDPELENVKSSVCANTTQLDTFDKVVATYHTFIESKKHHTKAQNININVSQVGTNYASRNNKGGSGNRTQHTQKIGGEEDGYDPTANYDAHKVDTSKYYQTNEWNNSLNKNQRNYMRQNSRGARKRGGNSRPANVSEVKSSVLKSLLKKQKILESTVASLTASANGNESDADGMDDYGDDEEDSRPLKKRGKPLQVPRKKR
jgi:hypothetical protein